MRLKSIRLAGFKSFVDPTTVSFPSNLCAIVGPNGCGKSNIIDAVRWVMGESSARHLRAEAGTDVIFNGSSARKPTALATIELLFDNSDRRIGGEYAAYGEIAIKRQISRDGNSQYYLNGVRCRRRDVLDVFLGTGFGARSYSIIEQGMISELVEAKPEELRAYLEEAAGISKYKERRRETETRIRHTRENLARLADLRGELATQIARLERQAEAAERYRQLKEAEGQLQAQVLGLRWRDFGVEADQQASFVRGCEVDHERERAEQRRLEAAVEQARAGQETSNARFNEVQGRFYAQAAELVRIEEAIAMRTRRREELTQELSALLARAQVLDAEFAAAETTLTACSERDSAARPQVATAEQEVAAEDATLATANAAHREATVAFEQFTSAASAHQRRVDACDSRIEHTGMLIERLDARRLLLEDEAKVLGTGDGDDSLLALEARATAMAAELDGVAGTLKALAARIADDRTAVTRAEEGLEEARRQWQERQRELSGLAAVQDAALGRRDSVAGAWLQSAGLADARRLAESLQVAAGWEMAVEAVLGAALSGVLVDRLDDHMARLDTFERGRVLLVEPSAMQSPVDVAATALSRLVTGEVATGLLAGVHAVETLAEALALRASLPAGASVVTRAGCVVGPNWMRVSRDEEQEQGVLLRAQQLASLSVATEQAGALVEAARERLAEARRLLGEHEAERAAAQQRLADGNRELGGLRAEVSANRVRVEETRARRSRIEREHGELVNQISAERANRDRHRQEQLALAAEAERMLVERSQLDAQRNTAGTQLETARRSQAAARDRRHGLALAAQSAAAALTAAKDSVERLHVARTDVADRSKAATALREEIVAPLPALIETRAGALTARTDLEQELALARQALDTGAQSIRELEADVARVAAAAEAVRDRLATARVAYEGVRARRGAVAEQLRALGEEVELVAARLLPEASVETSEAELARVQTRITRLGAINLAAISEFEAQTERKRYLDAQNDDLEAALATLEDAIGKIDRETRARFRETFDAVNVRLAELFPKVFGGGEASLQMEGDDVLSAGITFMARPPGKRNASIHLLSGGEKALTALALIFSIFQLNPSPVCMLDEVDAPLDDTNVARYAALIKEMSADVQFVYVTHNKISMEMADQLMGVTMQEPGVSRLVSVDVERAMAMAGG